MTETNNTARLRSCFLAVFPGLDPASVETASVTTVSEWDSINQITLINIIEEEFGIPIDIEVLGELTSWQAIHQYVNRSS